MKSLSRSIFPCIDLSEHLSVKVRLKVSRYPGSKMTDELNPLMLYNLLIRDDLFTRYSREGKEE
jgi:hypothetical protein